MSTSLPGERVGGSTDAAGPGSRAPRTSRSRSATTGSVRSHDAARDGSRTPTHPHARPAQSMRAARPEARNEEEEEEEKEEEGRISSKVKRAPGSPKPSPRMRAAAIPAPSKKSLSSAFSDQCRRRAPARRIPTLS